MLDRPLLFAFGFASPWLLGGLALAGIPILIHLLYKRRFRETPWAAMRFLLEAARKNSRRMRLEQLVLLSIRMLMLVLLSVALARPIADTIGAATFSRAALHRIIVLDASFSMGCQEGSTTRFERARQIARQVADESSPGDAFNVVLIRGEASTVVVREPSRDRNQILEEIAQLRVTEERGNVIACMRDVTELAKLVPEIPQKEISIISDFQRDNWHPESNGGETELRRLLNGLAEQSRIVMLDAKQENVANSAVMSITSEEPVPIVGHNIPVRALLRNFGDKPLDGRKVELLVDGRLSETRAVNLLPGTDMPVEFQPLFRESGDHLLEVRLQEDSLAIDNRRLLVLPVRNELRVLLVNGRPAGRPVDSATYYLDRVLAPSTARESWSGSTRPRVIGDGELAEQNLNEFDCVSLCNIRLFTDREAEILKNYVESGGGLILWLGDRVESESYNRWLYRDEKGVLPAQLNERVGDAKNPVNAFLFDAAQLEHPILGRFRGNPGTGLETTLTFEYFRVAVGDGTSSRVVLKFQSGDPAIVEKSLGRGRVILVTTAPDLSWGTWPVQRSFPPLVHETVRYAIAGRLGERQHLVGGPIVRTVQPTERISGARVLRPDGEQTALTIANEQDGSGALVYSKTDRSGAYELQLTAPTELSEKFGFNVDTRESNLAADSVEQLQQEHLPASSGSASLQRGDSEQVVPTASPVTELSGWLLVAVLCLLFVEQLMAWNFAYGLLLLYVCVAAGFIRHAFAWNMPAGVVVTILFSAGFVACIIWQRRAARSAGQ